MSIIQGTTKVSAGGYEIDQSIRFNDNDSAYLSRTSGSADSERKFASVSMWLKRCNLTSRQNFYSVNSAGSTGASNQISMAFENSGTNGDSITYNNGAVNRQSTSVYRDVSGWYHFVQIFDTTQATAADRVKTYINGVLLTDLNIGQDFSLNSNTPFGQSGVLHYIGRRDSGFYYDGYMAEIVFTVGQTVAVTDFGETNDDGVWVPKAYAGTYGTNGFYITGADSADLGEDFSGNGNDFTSSGLTSDDQMLDTPTDNAAVFNPLFSGGSYVGGRTISDGNLVFSKTGAGQESIFSTIAFNAEDDTYAEFVLTTAGGAGATRAGIQSADNFDIENTAEPNLGPGDSYGYAQDGSKYGQGVYTSSWGASFTSGDVIGVRLNNGSLYFYKNGTEQGGGAAWTGITGNWYFGVGGESGCVWTARFPSGVWTQAPSGVTSANSLTTANLPAPTIKDGSAYFQATLYTGNGTAIGSGGNAVSQSENSTFQPDFVWIKRRDSAVEHVLTDAVRGVTEELSSNDTGAEETVAEGLTTFSSSGFTVGSDGSYNTNTGTYAAWQWLAGNGTASNTDGTITSTVSANTTAGFSIVSYTGNATSGATIGHGLSQAPEVVITKSRDNGTGRNWAVFHADLGPTKYLELDNTNLANTSSTRWNDTAPSSTVVTLGSQQTTNDNGAAMIAYCWHSVEGFSKFGSYTGNGSADGPFIWCGFRPAFVIAKRTDSGDNWAMYDSARDTYNVAEKYLYADATNAEATFSTAKIDFLSNGFKWRGAVNFGNASGGTYIFMAFAEHPFGGDGAVPVPAR